MSRARIALIADTDLVYPISKPGFTDQTASDLDSGFPLADGFDELLLNLATAVSDDMKGLGAFDTILSGIDDGDGAVADTTLSPVMDSFATTQAQGQPVVDSLSATLGKVTGSNFTVGAGGGGSGNPPGGGGSIDNPPGNGGS